MPSAIVLGLGRGGSSKSVGMTINALKPFDIGILPPGICAKEITMNVHENLNVVCSKKKNWKQFKCPILGI